MLKDQRSKISSHQRDFLPLPNPQSEGAELMSLYMLRLKGLRSCLYLPYITVSTTIVLGLKTCASQVLDSKT